MWILTGPNTRITGQKGKRKEDIYNLWFPLYITSCTELRKARWLKRVARIRETNIYAIF
jgi:hypothetical protein